ncbi:hypothetical protein J4H92_12955 [Leucobacter weissii]|uniref:PH domain-containing protein n=1 Tax=Leucobacter weissii TaxID=1983706 RepID=A0A939MTT7_9MICO|nr:hypothetical protein [Leucobacter weissii]MBO1902854.1 hypothetical protein [Leucobacter weissii]
MSREMFAIVWTLVVLAIFAAMWWGWRSRKRRDAGIAGAATAPGGEILAEFPGVLYVSTTPEEDPLARVAVPGLSYRGRADVTVRAEGVTVEVVGERPVHLASAQILGSGRAAGRVGKAVEKDGLALLRWSPQQDAADSADDSGTDARRLESSFRFIDPSEQRRFCSAVDQVAGARSEPQPHTESREDTI